MVEIDMSVGSSPSMLKAFSFNEADITFSIQSGEDAVRWVECIIEVQPPLSLAPDKRLLLGKTLVGILSSSHRLEKRVKLYTDVNTAPGSYEIKLTVYMYDEDGAISDRKDFYKEIAIAGRDMHAQVL
jgi:hypothetical protein